MQKNSQLEFETIPAQTSGLYVCLPTFMRACVPGGWFVLLVDKGDDDTNGFFYPDPQHAWNGGTT